MAGSGYREKTKGVNSSNSDNVADQPKSRTGCLDETTNSNAWGVEAGTEAKTRCSSSQKKENRELCRGR